MPKRTQSAFEVSFSRCELNETFPKPDPMALGSGGAAVLGHEEGRNSNLTANPRHRLYKTSYQV